MGFFLLVFVISLADYFVLLNKHYYMDRASDYFELLRSLDSITKQTPI